MATQNLETNMTQNEIKEQVLGSLETIRQMRHGFRVADLVFCGGVPSAVATAALRELVSQGVLTASQKGRCLVYRAS